MTTNTPSPSALEISALLAKRASRPTWEKVCGVLDRTPADELDAAIAAVDAGLATWPDDLNDGNMWVLPPRQASKAWAKSIAAGKPAPAAWSVISFLQLHDHRFGKKGSGPLFANPALASLTHLYLAQCGLGPTGLQELIDSPHTGAVTHLVIGGNTLGEGCAAKLLTHTLGQQLHMLDIGRNQLGVSDLDALLTTPLPALRSLCFDYTDLSQKKLERILKADTLPALQAITVGKFNSDLNLELARTTRGHDHIKRALWQGALRCCDVPKLQKLAAERALTGTSKLNRPALIAALLPLDP
jgi:hypothetical protein